MTRSNVFRQDSQGIIISFEAVETEEKLNLLIEEFKTEMQGWYCSQVIIEEETTGYSNQIYKVLDPQGTLLESLSVIRN